MDKERVRMHEGEEYDVHGSCVGVFMIAHVNKHTSRDAPDEAKATR